MQKIVGLLLTERITKTVDDFRSISDVKMILDLSPYCILLDLHDNCLIFRNEAYILIKDLYYLIERKILQDGRYLRLYIIM